MSIAADVVNEVTGLLERSQVPEAIARARRALDEGVEAPLLLNLRAYWLEGQKRPLEALKDLERAEALSPKDPAIVNALGLCLANLGRMEEALTRFQTCAVLAPTFVPARYNCGWALEELGALEKAREAFEEATRLDPNAPAPLARLASLAARRGQWNEARRLAEATLRLAPDHPAAVIALADAERAQKEFAPARTRLKALIASPQAGERDRATALGLLGDVLDAEGSHREAFAAYAQSNAHFQRLFEENAAVQAEMPMRDYVAWLLKSFETPWPRVFISREASRTPKPPVFVLGFPRSGTTLVEEILACHPDVATTGEKDALSGIVRALFASPIQLERLRGLDEEGLAPYRQQYRDALGRMGINADAPVIVDKQPFNAIRLPLIAKLFPGAKIVFCLRDPRDVVLSCFRRRFNFNAANVEFLSLDRTAGLYDMVMRLWVRYGELFPLPTLTLRNEDIVADFDGQIRALCDFVGLGWVDALRDFANRSRVRDVATPSATQIQQGLERRGIGQWRRYAPEMAPVLPVLAPWVERFGYPKD